ncbi:hypothetical protein [Sphingomonas montana]|uniref:hypothetical protein n=1 Tax=Sphingomonas montana TaxID=1843236 RepID=UPI00101AE606|nr:hypothetical protein [Sphingomonas montana]
MRKNVLMAVVATLAPSSLWACTLCHSRIAEDTRATVMGHDLWSNMAALLLPFPLLFAAVLLARRVAP